MRAMIGKAEWTLRGRVVEFFSPPARLRPDSVRSRMGGTNAHRPPPLHPHLGRGRRGPDALNRRTLWAVTLDVRRQAARHECALRGQAPMVSASAPGSRMPSGVLAGVTSPSASMDSSGGASDVSTTILPSLAVA